MKSIHITAIALMAAGVAVGCRETRTESQTLTEGIEQDTANVNTTDGINPGVSAEDPERPSWDSGVQGGENGTGNGTEKANGSTSQNGTFSGDGSDGRTNGTAVNKAKAVQVMNRTNAARNSKTGYSAPDGTAAENHDGDMYTKHDTTRMPSGQTPIK